VLVWKILRKYKNFKKGLLITGGRGSFGNVVLRWCLSTDINEIGIFSRHEKKQYDMRKAFSNEKFKFYVGDFRDPESLSIPMRAAHYVFHAAALKVSFTHLKLLGLIFGDRKCTRVYHS
tara:strand:- start:5961 stop:6317 length:357 start_codon:yes stop_codon:yes gene_type:complete